jgi:tetratricopeptide (TPR) repeat protein
VQAVLIPSFGLVFNEMGHHAFEAGDLDRAESLHGLAVGILPDAPVLLDNLGMVYLDRFTQSSDKRFLDDAERFYRKAIAADPQAPGLKRHLEAAFIQKLTGDAERDLMTHRQIIEIDREILVSDPFNPFVRGNLAEALYNTGERKAAEEEMVKAIAIEPNYVTGHLRLAEWCRQSGDTFRSNKHWNRAMSIVAEYRNVTEPEHYEALLLGRPANGPEVKP